MQARKSTYKTRFRNIKPWIMVGMHQYLGIHQLSITYSFITPQGYSAKPKEEKNCTFAEATMSSHPRNVEIEGFFRNQSVALRNKTKSAFS
jgi:hypothetical protein